MNAARSAVAAIQDHPMDPAPKEEYIPRNYWLGLLNGIMVLGGNVFLDPQSVIAVFMLSLGMSPKAVGICQAGSAVGIFLPTLFLAHLIDKAERKKSYYYLSAASRAAFLGVLALSPVLLGLDNAMLLGWVVVIALSGYYVSISIGLLTFFEISSHSVPARMRGNFFGYRRAIGSVLALGCIYLLRCLLARGPQAEEVFGFLPNVVTMAFGKDSIIFRSPYNYAAIFGFALLLCGGGSLAFCFV